MTSYRVQKEYKDTDGFFTYDILFESQDKNKADEFRTKLPKDTKRTQYIVRGFNKVTITKAEQLEAEKIRLLCLSNWNI